MFASLRHRDFRLFWCGQLISLVGTWMQSVGQSWLVLELTKSPFKLGLISSLQFTPTLLLALFAGVWVDRLPKKKVIIVTQTVLMACAFILFSLTITGLVRYWHVAVLAVVLGMAQSLDMPARQAFIVDMVGKEDLMNAIALNSAMFNGARIVGPGVAGLVVAATGSAWAFFINGASFIAVIAALFFIRAESLPKAGSKDIKAEVLDGLRYAKATPAVLTCLLTLMLVSLWAINPQVLTPLLAKNILHRGAEGLGFLMSSMGVGALFGALFLAKTSRRGPRMKLVFGGSAALCLSELAVAGIHGFLSAIALMFLAGFSQISFTASVNTKIQSIVPDDLRGRIMGLYALVFTGVTPVGSLLTGWAAADLGIRPTFGLAGGLGLLSAISMGLFWMHQTKSRRQLSSNPQN